MRLLVRKRGNLCHELHHWKHNADVLVSANLCHVVLLNHATRLGQHRVLPNIERTYVSHQIMVSDRVNIFDWVNISDDHLETSHQVQQVWLAASHVLKGDHGSDAL